MRRLWAWGLPAILLLAAGCATKDWVREVMGTQNTETARRFSQVEGRMSDESARVADIEKHVEGASRGVQRAQERADGAFGRAEAAFARADEADGRLTRLWSKRHARNQVDRIEVTFGFGRHDLDDGAQTRLAALVKELQANPNLTVDLTGYTDPKGPLEYNIGLSQRRVEAVRRFLIRRGIEVPRIHFVGLGVLDDPRLPDAKKRLVTVNLMLAAD
jgi:outer membrane protein OmpA-like peptidoglycan-associated protein